jgi:predicted glycosyltransferase
MSKIWFDFTNPPHVNQFLPIINELKSDHEILCTAREFVETTKLLRKYRIDFKLIGGHGGKNKLFKALRMVGRDVQLAIRLPEFDVSISSNYEAPQTSWFLRKKAIVFDDNDASPNWLYAPFVYRVFSPKLIDSEKMARLGIPEKKLVRYDGFKEDIYIADYIPDNKFLETIPFKEFVTVRPENVLASYVNGIKKSIVPDLIEKLTSKNINVLYLPRYESDKKYIRSSDKVFIPESPLRGLDVCYHSLAVLTGAGTFSREAALMGIPAVSFFAGDDFLTVDKHLFKESKVFYSREVDAIIDYVITSKRKAFNADRSKQVKADVLTKLRAAIN